MENMKDLINAKIRHLSSLKIHLEGYDPHRTENDILRVKATARMLSTDIADILDVAKAMNEITDDEYFTYYQKTSKLRNSHTLV